MDKKPFACPLCGGSVWLELPALARCRVNGKTGEIGKARLYDHRFAGPLGVHCDHCGRGFIAWRGSGEQERRIVEVEQEPVPM